MFRTIWAKNEMRYTSRTNLLRLYGIGSHGLFAPYRLSSPLIVHTMSADPTYNLS